MLGGLDPRRLAKIQSATKGIVGVITIDYADGTILLKLSPTNDAAKSALPSLMESFSQALAQQLNTFFAISGKIIERNKPSATPV